MRAFSFMAIALAQRQPNTDAPAGGYPLSTLSTGNFGSAVTSGNALLLLWSNWHATNAGDWTASAYSDTLTHTYAHVAAAALGGESAAGIAYVLATSGGTNSITLAPGFSENAIEMHGIELSGVDGTGTFYGGNTAGATSSSTPSVSTGATVASADDWVIAVCSAYNGTADAGIDLPSGWTQIGVRQEASSEVAYMSCRITGQTGTVTADFGTLSAAGDWSAAILVVKAASAGGASILRQMLMNH